MGSGPAASPAWGELRPNLLCLCEEDEKIPLLVDKRGKNVLTSDSLWFLRKWKSPQLGAYF